VAFHYLHPKRGSEGGGVAIVRDDGVDTRLEIEALLFEKRISDIDEDRGRRGHSTERSVYRWLNATLGCAHVISTAEI
jgi:hypothetical protein